MIRSSKVIRIVIHLLCMLFITYYINGTAFNTMTKKRVTRYLPDIKYLLLWTKVHGIELSGQKHFVEKRCQSYNCYFTTNRDMFGDVQYFDGIIFNLQDVSRGMQELPRVRGHFQKYIFAANDSSDNYPVCDPGYEDFFNWTWTYKLDSTVPYKFFSIFNQQHENLGSYFSWKRLNKPTMHMNKKRASKSKAAAIILDECPTRSQREVFVTNLQAELKKYNMTVDVYGKYGDKQCRRKTLKPCFWKIKKFYFFYLAFEDSLATDYVTKSVLYAYNNDAVPIVYGKADYNKFLPPGSYLDGRGLGATKLAEIMYQVTYDPRRYNQFFNWKGYYTIEESDVLDVCGLCSALNNPTWLTYRSTYSKFREWWSPDYKKRCQGNRNKYKNL